ncbi:MAG: ATP-binding protein [Pseudomonadales bacterium]
MNLGIQSRLVVTTTCVLGAFLTLAGVVLDRSFKASTLAGAEEQLKLVVYSLMGVAEEYQDHVVFGELSEPRLSQPESGLYATVVEVDGNYEWRSPSALTTNVEFPETRPDLGEFVFSEVATGGVARYFLTYAVIWEDAQESVLVFQVATDQAPFRSVISGFRQNLYVGLGAVTLLVMIVQILAIRWGLTPLRVMAGEVKDLEEGRREQLSADYPKELRGLAENLDRFVEHEHRSRTRYRNALDDLAHSLKTPLAVIRNALREQVNGDPGLLQEQLDRMESTVTHQLSRASVSGPVVVSKSVNLHTVLTRLTRALQTAYLERGIQLEMRVPADLQARGDEGDFMEIFGNVLENAFKYTSKRVRVSGCAGDHVTVCVEDDGPGIGPEIRRQVLNRGTRADQVQPGQGIGLAVVAELVTLYHGALDIDTSELGGAAIELTL